MTLFKNYFSCFQPITFIINFLLEIYHKDYCIDKNGRKNSNKIAGGNSVSPVYKKEIGILRVKQLSLGFSSKNQNRMYCKGNVHIMNS